MGFTWVCGGFALNRWLFEPGFKTTFGSRKGEYVDRIGDPDSIFEKIRMLLYGLPAWMQPTGFNRSQHDNSMLIFNPENGNTIRGESGDQMGRGGRSTMYFIDEAAFIERAERVEASTSANADVRIWGSSVNGPSNLFARKRFGGTLRPDQVFRFHWRDDPRKTMEWAEKKQGELEGYIWASEYDIDYSASVEGICIPAKWVDAAQRIGPLLTARATPVEPAVTGICGLDVGAGKAKSVAVARFGPVVAVPRAWGDPDTTETAHRGLDYAQETTAKRSNGQVCKVGVLRFDSVGIGAGVQSALKRHNRRGLVTDGINVGIEPSDMPWPDGETSEEKFTNLKAELWWLMRARFKATYEMLLHIEGLPGGQVHSVSDLIVLPPLSQGKDCGALASQISLPKWFRNEKGKIQMESKIDLARRGVASPDHADALALTFAENNGLVTWAKLGARA